MLPKRKSSDSDSQPVIGKALKTPLNGNDVDDNRYCRLTTCNCAKCLSSKVALPWFHFIDFRGNSSRGDFVLTCVECRFLRSMEQKCLAKWTTLKHDPVVLAGELSVWAATYIDSYEEAIEAKLCASLSDGGIEGFIQHLKEISPDVIDDLAKRGSLRKYYHYRISQGADVRNDQATRSSSKGCPDVDLEPCLSDNENQSLSLENDASPCFGDEEDPDKISPPHGFYMRKLKKQALAPLSTPAKSEATSLGSTVMRRRIITPRLASPQQAEAIENAIESLQDLSRRPPAARERIMSATGFTVFAEKLKEKLMRDNEMEKLQAENAVYYAKILENDRRMDALGDSSSLD